MNSTATKTLRAAGAAAIGLTAWSLAAARKRFSFRNRSVLITGGSRGLGLEIARRFAREGANITIVGRNGSSLGNAARDLEAYEGSILAIPCDIRKREQVQAAVREHINRWGGIDVLVNNAGIIQVGPYEQMTIEDYQNAMATHLWGSLYTVLEVLPHMKRQHAGRIVNISSIGGRIGVPHLLPYSISKFALAGLSEALAAEVSGQGIQVTSVFPGLMRTGSHVNAFFKGDYRKEFAWFSISGSMPVLTINSRRAATQIVEAARRGQRNLVITPAAKMAALVHGVAPSLVMESLRLTNAVLPGGDSQDGKISHPGWESRSPWSPSLATRLSDKAIDRNNERMATNQL